MSDQLPGNPYIEKITREITAEDAIALSTLAAAFEQRTANLITAYQDDSLMSRLSQTEQAALQDRIINRLNLKENK